MKKKFYILIRNSVFFESDKNFMTLACIVIIELPSILYANIHVRFFRNTELVRRVNCVSHNASAVHLCRKCATICIDVYKTPRKATKH